MSKLGGANGTGGLDLQGLLGKLSGAGGAAGGSGFNFGGLEEKLKGILPEGTDLGKIIEHVKTLFAGQDLSKLDVKDIFAKLGGGGAGGSGFDMGSLAQKLEGALPQGTDLSKLTQSLGGLMGHGDQGENKLGGLMGTLTGALKDAEGGKESLGGLLGSLSGALNQKSEE